MFGKDELVRKIALTKIPRIGDKLLKVVLDYFGSVEAIYSVSDEELKVIPRLGPTLVRFRKNKSILEEATKEAAFVRRHDLKFTFFLDADYPYRLKECSDGPALLYYKGKLNLNCNRIISIVGTRQSTAYGQMLCNQLIKQLASIDSSILIVSGLAYGIDILAHRAALDHQMPTLGILAHGLDRIYPAAHRATAKKMLENGGLLTEFPSETNPDPQNFVKRNRIIAGLADACIVIESAEKGGALITANIAASYNRDVLAFPGPIDAEVSKGCNWLIKTNQATLIENASDLMRQMNWVDDKKQAKAVQQSLFHEMNKEELEVFELLRKEGEMALNFISIALDRSVSKCSVLLFNMEMKGIVQVQPGNVYRLA